MTEPLTASDIEAIRRGFERVSARGWGVALGVLSAVGLFLATVVLVIKGGPDAGAHLGLLSNFFPGFDISWSGAGIGALYAALVGYGAGWLTGASYNFFIDRGQ